MVGQTSDLLTQDATHVPVRSQTISGSEQGNEQIDVIAGGGDSQLVPSSNSIEIMLRAALRESLPQ
eukprot:5492860-Amphidinium_carterae.1